MKNRIIISTLLVSILLIAGCDKYTRYKVATFFFTGVPPIYEEDPLAEKKEEIRRPLRKGKLERLPPIIPAFVHGPYGTGECELCHETTATAAFRRPEKKKARIITGVSQSIAGRLVMPVKDLCIECHITKSQPSAFKRRLWLHGPVASGMCTICHNAHQSPFRYMLLKESSIELCTQCHTKGYITEIEEHKRDEECISCHNPHLGKNRFLLKKDYTEIF
jgi:predicted CXXCH cytochrome family protein